MANDEIKARVLSVLAEVAPETRSLELDPEKSFRDQIDLDSVDYLRYVLGLEEKFGLKVPELDYPKLSSLKGSLDYLESRRTLSS